MRDYYIAILHGSLLTVTVSLASLAVATLLGLAGAAAKLSGRRALVWTASFYTTVVRGIPELLMMLLIFYGGAIGINHAVDRCGVPPAPLVADQAVRKVPPVPTLERLRRRQNSAPAPAMTGRIAAGPGAGAAGVASRTIE